MSSQGVAEEIAASLRQSMSPGDRLASWTLRWSIAHGRLVCNHCQAWQPSGYACESFNHRTQCVARRDKWPWRELAQVLAQPTVLESTRR